MTLVCYGFLNLNKMCIQKIGSTYVKDFQYGCNSCTVTIHSVTHNLNKLISFTENSCILSNDISTFELYTPSIEINKIKECFSCSQKVTLDNILGGVSTLINNSFNTNSNNTNSNNHQCYDNNEINNKLDNIQSSINEGFTETFKTYKMTNSDHYYLLIIIICICLTILILTLTNK